MENYLVVDGLNTRYLEEGVGPVVLLLHGASLGSSLEVYEKNIPVFAKAGMHTIAFDLPGYGLTDNPKDYKSSYRSEFILKFMDAMGIDKASLVAHSGTGDLAAQIALKNPQRVEKVVALAATGLLPPLPDQKGGRADAVESPPTIESTRKRLESDLFIRSLITEEMVQKRYRMSTGKNFDNALERAKATQTAKGTQEESPLWKRFSNSSIPKLYLYGKEDRSNTAQRCAMLSEMEPTLKFHLIEQCVHLVMVDTPEEFNKAAIEFILS